MKYWRRAKYLAWFLWHWAFDPTLEWRDETVDKTISETYDRGDFYNIAQPTWWRDRFLREAKECGCQYRWWGKQAYFCMKHVGL